LARVKALRNKQRSGNVEFPTPMNSPALSAISYASSNVLSYQRVPSPQRGRLQPSMPPPPLPQDSQLPMSLEELSLPAPQTKTKQGFKGLFSYLPVLSKPSQPTSKRGSHRPGLPPPPPELIQKQRGPIATPARPPIPLQTHPKELVNLQPAPPITRSFVPRLVKPQRLVNLHPIPLPAKPQPVIHHRQRTSSGSVKDIVKSFEDWEGSKVAELEALKHMRLRRVKSVGHEMKGKPVWKP